MLIGVVTDFSLCMTCDLMTLTGMCVEQLMHCVHGACFIAVVACNACNALP